MTVERSSRTRFVHWLRYIAGAATALFLVGVLVVHLPVVQSRLLSMIAAGLANRGIQLDASALRYNLATLSVALERPVLSAVTGGPPFFGAEAVRLDLSWSFVAGGLHVQLLDVRGARIDVVRFADGTTNLPPLESDGGSGPGMPLPLVIDRLVVSDLAIRYLDEPNALLVEVPGLALDLSRPATGRLSGPLSISRPAALRRGDHSTTVATLSGQLAFDGVTLYVDRFTVGAPEGRAEISGTYTLLATEPHLELRATGELDVARLADWTGQQPGATGRVTFSAALNDAGLAVDASSTTLTWPGVGGMTLESRATVSTGAAVVESLRLTVAGGEVLATGRFAGGEVEPSAADVRWRNVDAGVLARAAAPLPFRIASVSDGSLHAEWNGADVPGARARMSAELRAGATQGRALPISGSVDLAVADRRWTLAATPAVPGAAHLTVRAGGALSDALSASTLTGRAAVDVTDLARMRQHLTAIDVVPAEGTLVAGTAAGRFDLSGTLASPRAVGTIESNDMRVATAEPAVVFARLDASRQRAAVDDLRISIGSNVIRGNAGLRLPANSMAGTFTADLQDLATAAFLLPKQWRPQGSARVSATLAGTLAAPTIDVSATSDAIQVAGQSMRSLSATGRLSEGVATLRTLELSQNEGALTGSGQYVLRDGHYSFTMAGRDLVVSPLAISPDPAVAPTPVTARFAVQLEGQGTIESPQASGRLEFASLDWAGYNLGPVHANAALSGDQLEVRADVPSASGRIDATVNIRERHVNASATLNDVDLMSLARPSGPGTTGAQSTETAVVPFTGTATVRATAVGPVEDLTAMAIGVEARLSNTSVNGVPIRVDTPLRARHEAGEIIAENVRLNVGRASLAASGRMGTSPRAGDELRVTLKGPLADLSALAKAVPGLERLDGSGDLDLDLAAVGPLSAPVVRGKLALTGASLSFDDDLPQVSSVNLAATLESGVIEADEIGAEWQGATLTGEARLPLSVLGDLLPAQFRASLAPEEDRATATLRVTSLTPAALSSFVDESTLARIGGRVDLEAAFRASALDPDAVDGEVTLSSAEMSLAGVPIRQVAPTRLRVSRGRADVVDWRWQGPSGRIDVGGYVRMAEESPEINLGVAGTLDLRMLGAFVPNAAFSGNAIIDARALGTIADPDLSGQMTVSGATVAIRDPRVAISDLDGAATLTRNGLELRAKASANGGAVEASGSITYSGTPGGAITLAGRGLAFELVDGLRTEADADLTLSVGERHALTGQVTILRGAYREPLQLATQIFSGRASEIVALAPEEPGLLDRVQLNITVVSAEDIVVDNNYGRLDIGSHVALIGTAASPAVAGRLAFREGGRVFLGGQTYTVRRGSVDFTNPARIEPLFDLSLDTRVQNYEITLELRGTPEDLDVSLRSPGLSQQEAVSLLLTGQKGDSNIAYAEIARGQLLMLLSGEVLGVAGRAIGIDTVQVGRGLGGAASTFDLLATESDPEARLTLTKRLRPDVDLIVSQSLQESGDITWIATYQPVSRVELRATTDDEQSETYEFRHEVPFGGGVPAIKTAASLQPRVARVDVTTDAGVPEADARARLHLEAGDRFDFYRFQQDRDRLVSWLHEQGRLEARVASRRTDGADGTVTAVHTITAGPLTTLRVQGFDLPAADVARMRQAWSASVFDGFLVEDLQRIARESLVRSRFVQSEVSITIDTSATNEKVALVSITPGPRYLTRRLDFRGNEQVPTANLEAFAEAGDLVVTAWVDGGALTSALESHYRALGFLAASAAVEAPVFSDDTAALPVRIHEGPLFRVGSVSVKGVTERQDDDIRRLFGLEPGTPYDPRAVEPARRRVEASYLDSGYTRARASAAVAADRSSGTVDVTLTVQEGPREVLADVAVSGATMTSRGTIDHALNLKTDQPLNMSAIYEAQKRLYDTGVFRTVDISVNAIDGSAAAPAVAQPVRASVTVQELPRYQFRYGFRVTDLASPAEGTRSVQPGLMADLLNRNVFGRAITAGVAGQLEPDRFLARGILSLPTLFGLPVISNLFLTRSREEFTPEAANAFREDSTELTAEQRFRPARTSLVTYGYSYARTHTFDPNPDPTSPLPPLDFRTDVARLSGTYAWDTRNDPSNATRGWLHSSGVEYGPEVLGSDLRFLRYLGQQYYFRTVGERFSLASALRVGAGRGFDQDLIPSEKFYTGGGTSVRGFAEDGIGPTNFFGDPIGGNAMLVLNQEVRARVHRWASVVGFLDAGNVFRQASDLSFRGLEAGTGLGLRIISPFAILRVDVGFPLTSRDDQPAARWYFGIGQTY